MKKLLVSLAIIIVVIVAAALVAPSFIPADKIKAQIVSAVKSSTGRDLTIAGNVSASVLPALSVQVTNVALSNPPGFAAKDLARLGALDVRLKILPLLKGEIEVDSFKLVDPVITLEVNAKGQADWTFATASSTKAESGSSSSAGMMNDIHLGNVGIKNGKLIYSDARSGKSETLDAINVTIGLKDLDTPLTVEGDLTWRNQPVTLKLDAAKPRVMIAAAGTTPLSITVSAAPVKLTFTGKAAGANKNIDGTVDLAVPSVRDLVAWTTGKPLDMPGTGLGPLAIKGNLALAGGRVSFSDAAVTLDAIKSNGEISIDTSGARPVLKGKLAVEALDLNPYLPPETQAKAKAETPANAAPSQGWSDDPIDASALKAADVDFALSVGSIKMRKIEIGKSAVNVALHGGQLALDLTDIELYKGSGKGTIKLDGNQAGIGMDADFSLKGIQAEPLLTDAIDFTRLSGTGNTEIQLAGRGRSQREIIASLAGKGSVAFLDGAIKGIDIAGMARNVTSAFTGGGAAQKTDFSELSGSYTIASGILSNKDLSLKAPVLRVAGAGTVDLPQRTVNYRVEPKLAATLEGQGGKSDIGGITGPIVIAGPWDHLSYRPDLGSVAKGAATQAVQGVLSGGKAPSLKGLLQGFGK
jgi:AsmA protein